MTDFFKNEIFPEIHRFRNIIKMLEIEIYQKNERILLRFFFAYALDENVFYIPTKYGRNQFCFKKVYFTKLK